MFFLRTMVLLALVFMFMLASTANAQMIKWVYVDTIEDLVPFEGELYLPAGGKVSIPIRILNMGTPDCKFAVAMPFIVESPDGATWDTVVLKEQELFSRLIFDDYHAMISTSGLFNDAFYEGFSLDGQGGGYDRFCRNSIPIKLWDI